MSIQIYSGSLFGEDFSTCFGYISKGIFYPDSVFDWTLFKLMYENKKNIRVLREVDFDNKKNFVYIDISISGMVNQYVDDPQYYTDDDLISIIMYFYIKNKITPVENIIYITNTTIIGGFKVCVENYFKICKYEDLHHKTSMTENIIDFIIILKDIVNGKEVYFYRNTKEKLFPVGEHVKFETVGDCNGIVINDNEIFFKNMVIQSYRN